MRIQTHKVAKPDGCQSDEAVVTGLEVGPALLGAVQDGSPRYRDEGEEKTGENQIQLCGLFLPAAKPGSQFLDDDAATLVHPLSYALQEGKGLIIGREITCNNVTCTWNMMRARGMPTTE